MGCLDAYIASLLSSECLDVNLEKSSHDSQGKCVDAQDVYSCSAFSCHRTAKDNTVYASLEKRDMPSISFQMPSRKKADAKA